MQNIPDPPPVTTTILPANGKSPATMVGATLRLYIETNESRYKIGSGILWIYELESSCVVPVCKMMAIAA